LERDNMPKVIVLYAATDSSAGTLAAAAAEGAKGIRFTEVDVRVVGGSTTTDGQRHRQLEDAERIQDYDGAIVVVTGAAMSSELGAVLDALETVEPVDGVANKVFAIAGDNAPVLLPRVARLGSIIVSPPRGLADTEAAAKALGMRVAKVSEWVRHALSHEAKDHHHH
jgi:hypothetical protein